MQNLQNGKENKRQQEQLAIPKSCQQLKESLKKKDGVGRKGQKTGDWGHARLTHQAQPPGWRRPRSEKGQDRL